MRSTRRMPGNPWPHDMMIRIDDWPHAVNLLLFVRYAWGLAPDADVPALDPEPQPGTSSAPPQASLDEWSRRWERQWQRTWEWHAMHEPATLPTPELLRTVNRPGQPLNPVIPPHWFAEYGDAGVDRKALTGWEGQLMPIHGRQPVSETPERVCLPALISAWETGVEELITPPYVGYFARRISRRVLVVSRTTRETPEFYNKALAMAAEQRWNG